MEWTLWFWLGGAATFHISMDPSPVLVSLGSDVLLQCIFPAVGKDTPTPTVFWHHGQWRLAEYDGILVTQRPGTELPESAEGLRKGNASLLLHRVAMADLGSYYCTVTVGEQQAEAGVLLEISGSDLQIYTEPSSWVTMGSSALLKCRFSIGDVIELSSLTIRWYAPGGRIVAQFPPKKEEEEEEEEKDVGEGPGGLTTLGSFSEAELLLGNASLTILRAQPKDAGLYSCSVGYGGEERHSESLFSVIAAPHISLFPVQVSLGEKITLLCQIKGFYPARGLQAWWLRNGQRLPEAISMGSPTQNPDGTFDLELILNLTLESHDLEANFSCHVTHPALEHPLQQILDMEVKEEKWWEDVQSNNRPSIISSILIILITTLGITVIVFAIIHSLRRNRGLEEEEQEQGEVRTATDEEDREQPQETSDFQSPGRNWEVEKLLPRDHIESEGDILQGDRKAGFLQGYRKTVGLMEVRYSRIKRQIIVECRETEDNILVLEDTREGQVLVEKGESKGQNLEGYGESEGRVLEEFEVDTEIQFQEAKAIKSEGQLIKGNREIEVHKRDKEATEKQNGEGQTEKRDAEGQTEKRDAERQTQRGRENGLTQEGDREGLTQGGDSEGLTQGGDSEGLIQRGDSEGQIQGGDSEGLTQGGDNEGLTQRGDSEEQIQGGDSEGQIQGGDSEGLTQGGDSEELTQGGDSEGLTQGGDSEGLTQGGDNEGLTQRGDTEGLTQDEDSEGQIQGGDSEGLIQGGYSEGQIQGGDSEGLMQGGDSEGQIQGGNSKEEISRRDAKVQVHVGDEEAIKGFVFKEVGRNETRRIAGEGEAMEQIPSGYEGIEGWTSSGKIDTQSLRIDEDLSEQSPQKQLETEILPKDEDIIQLQG